ncbi:MAG: hypothetical protein KAV97_05700 [Actinomycetia bacterium]|nr:hypothetical protein [Actinomycetes bacterium]
MPACYRYIQCRFWQEPGVETWSIDEKYFYLYLLTNPNTTQCGVYNISIRRMSFNTGYDKKKVEQLIKKFTELKNKI